MTARAPRAFHFGPDERSLFGSWHEARVGLLRDAAVVIAPAVGHEYPRGHRALRILAERLAKAGFPVLRFDWSGTGDSAGDEEDARVADWIEDLARAVALARERSGRARACVLGLRLGATIAAHAAARDPSLDALVLWDPIVSGEAWIGELEAAHAAFLRSIHGTLRPEHRGDERDLVGFRASAALLADLRELRLADAALGGERDLLVVRTDAGGGPIAELVARNGVAPVERAVGDPRIWEEEEGKALVPTEALGAIAGWVAEVVG